MNEVLGKGGFGIVYAGMLGTTHVAVKKRPNDSFYATTVCFAFALPLPELQITLSQAFRREMETVEAIRQSPHQSIVRFFFTTALTGEWPKGTELCIVMERASMPLRDLITNARTQPAILNGATIIDYMKQIANGLRHLKAIGYAHLDLKPENILVFVVLAGHGTCKIGDFGSVFLISALFL